LPAGKQLPIDCATGKPMLPTLRVIATTDDRPWIGTLVMKMTSNSTNMTPGPERDAQAEFSLTQVLDRPLVGASPFVPGSFLFARFVKPDLVGVHRGCQPGLMKTRS
jgi:hypothetical protein